MGPDPCSLLTSSILVTMACAMAHAIQLLRLNLIRVSVYTQTISRNIHFLVL